MLQIRNITRTILASMLAVMVAVSFYPATAFADTDYEAAYNQAKANTQAAYTEWQNALTNVDTTYSAYQTAKTNNDATENTMTNSISAPLLSDHTSAVSDESFIIPTMA